MTLILKVSWWILIKNRAFYNKKYYLFFIKNFKIFKNSNNFKFDDKPESSEQKESEKDQINSKV